MVGVMQGRNAKGQFTSGNDVVGGLTVRLMGDASSYQKMLWNAQSMAANFGKAMSTYITAPLAIIGGLAVREFAKFDNAMTESLAIMQTTEQQAQRMKDTALELAKAGAKAPEEIARSYFYLASAGLNAEQAIKVLPVLLDFATAGAFDMARATELLMDAQAALGLKVADTNQNMLNAARVADVLTQANILSNASVEQFSVALTSKAGSAMKVFNIQVEEGTAVLAAMADQGIKAELAGNSFARILFLLSKASMDNQEAFRKFGFSMYNAEGQLRPLADIVENLTTILEPLSAMEKSAALEALGFEARVQGAVMPLIGTADAIRRYNTELKNATGLTKEIADKQLKSFTNQMKNVYNQVKVLAIGIGEQLASKLTALAEQLKSVITWWTALSDTTKKNTIDVAIWVGMIGPATLALAGFLQMLKWVVTSMSMSIAGVAAWPLVIAAVVTVLAVKAFDAFMRAASGAEYFEQAVKNLGRTHARVIKDLNAAHTDELASITGMPAGFEQGAVLADAMDKSRASLKRYMKEMESAGRAVKVATADQGWWASDEDKAKVAAAQALYDSKKAIFDAEMAHYKALGGVIPDQLKAEDEKTKAEEGLKVARINEMKTAVADYVKELQKEADTMGMTARGVKMYELAEMGATGAILAEVEALDEIITHEEERLKLIEEGKEMMKQYLGPMEQRKKTEEDLARLRAVGAIDQKTYDRAMKAAHKDYVAAKKEEARLLDQARLNYDFMNNRAVRENSAEFYTMMQQVPDKYSVRDAKLANVPGGGTGKDKVQEDQLYQLKRIAEGVQNNEIIFDAPVAGI